MGRVRVLAAWAALFLPPVFAGDPTLAVFLDFELAPPGISLETMKREVNRLMKPSGLHVNWRSVRQNEGKESFTSLVLMKFTGKCGLDFSAPPEEQPATTTLGTTTISQGRVLPFVDIRCDEVRKTLPYVDPAERLTALGRAMGRVVAHELYHFLANTGQHASSGLAKASQSWVELVNGNSGFEQRDSQAMRDGFTKMNRAAFFEK